MWGEEAAQIPPTTFIIPFLQSALAANDVGAIEAPGRIARIHNEL